MMKESCVKKLFETVKGIYQKKLWGELKLTFEKGNRYIYFQNGEIHYAKSEIDGERLGDFLVKHDYLSFEEVDAALSFSNWEKMKLGKYLINTHQLTSEEIEYAVLDVVNAIVASPFKEPFIKIEFHEGEIKGDSETIISISTGDILINSVRNLEDDSVFDDFYNVCKMLKPTNCAKSHDIYDNLRINPEEGFLFSRIDGYSTVEEIEKVTGFHGNKLARMLFGLTLLGIVEFKEEVKLSEKTSPKHQKITEPKERTKNIESPNKIKEKEAVLKQKITQEEDEEKHKPEVGRYSFSANKQVQRKEKTVIKSPIAKREPKVEEKLTQEELNFINEVKGIYKKINETSYYDLLNLDKNANSKEIKNSYMKMVKKFHPDKYAHKKFGNLGNILDKVFAFISTANTVLSDDKKRREYEVKELKLIKVKEDSYFGRKVNILIEKAHFDVEQGAIEDAETKIKEAIKYDSENPQLLIELGKIHMEFDDMFSEASHNFRKALKIDPALPDGYLWLARLAIKLGDVEKASKHYKNLQSFDSDNQEAEEFFEQIGNKKGVIGSMKKWFS